MAESPICKTKRDGVITILDNGGSNVYTVAFEDGDLSIDIPGTEVLNFPDRGVIGDPPCLRDGNEAAMTGSFTAILRDVSDATDLTLFEFIAESGAVSTTFVSTLGASGESRVYTITWTIEGTAHGDSADHVITCQFCKISGSVADGFPGVISISFTSWDVYPTVS